MSRKPMLKMILIVISAVIFVFLVIVAMQPSTYRVTRSVLVIAPPEAVFPHMNDLQKWTAWNPWGKADPNIKLTYGDPTVGVGANYSWAGNLEVGECRATIIESRPGESVKFKMEWIKPMAGISEDEFTFKPRGGQTEVTWTMTGEKKFMMKAFCLFRNMDKMMGERFEKGLADLKGIVESAGK